MNALSNRKTLTLGLSLGAIGVGAAIAACSGGSTTSGNGKGDGGPGNGGNPASPASCANPTIHVSFSPMYSAYIPGSTAHTFQIPAISDSTSKITWGSSDPTKVTLTDDPTVAGQTILTIQGTGSVNIIATASDGTCGSSALAITQNTETDWQTGNARYNDGNGLHFGHGGGDAAVVTPDAGPACTNCHGPTANNGVGYNDVSHTPEQTGGFSDQDLINIIVNGVVPDGGYFDPNVIIADASADPTGATQAKAYRRWQRFHSWIDITQDQQAGIIVYLRSLTPAPQDGTSNFGGFGGDGGHHHHDGGGGPPDGGSQTDSGPTPDTGSATDAGGD